MFTRDRAISLGQTVDVSGSLAAILLLAMSAISIIFDLAAIVLFARHKLQPVTFLVLSCIKSIFWIFIFAVDIADAVRGDTAGLVAAFALSAVLFLTSVGQIVYGAVVHHRKRKGITGRGNYGGVGGAGAGYRGADYDRTPRASVSYANGGAPPNPFRDPSREPSPAAAQRVPLTAAQEPSLSHPAFRKSGENETYYNNEPPHASFEMTTAYRDS